MQTLKLSQQRQQKNALGVLTLGSLIFQGVNALLLLGLLGAFVGLKDKAPPAMVQLEAGKVIAVEPMDSRYRTPAVIQKFVRDQLTLLMSASGQMPRTGDGDEGSVLVADPGVEVPIDGGSAKITTLARLAAFGISEDFRSAFVRDLAERTPQDVFSPNSGWQRLLIIQDVSVPEPIAEGQWKVTVISSLVDFQAGDPVGVPKPFNKEVFVQSVPAPAIHDFSSQLEKEIAEVRQAGLEIYAIRNYVRRNIQSPSRVEVEAKPSSTESTSTESFIDTRP